MARHVEPPEFFFKPFFFSCPSEIVIRYFLCFNKIFFSNR
jgi:hypothetical protein